MRGSGYRVSECKTTLGTWWILGGLGVVAGGGSGGSGFGYSLSGAGFGYAITGFLTGCIAEKERMTMFTGIYLLKKPSQIW